MKEESHGMKVKKGKTLESNVES